ncbi:PH domain-containing protein [Candidatus Peregrinibacteria bacterium]|nr:MAG: PH domain-containing protein [Candidatus Peregrinibacteria bacterium]
MKIFPNLSDRAVNRFEFLHENERCYAFFRRHGMCLLFGVCRHWLPYFLGYLLLLPLLFWVVNFFGEENALSFIAFAFNMVAIIFLVHWFFLAILEYMLGFMMITNRRIVELHKSVFLREEMSEMPFEQITNIHHEKSGFLQNILHYGTLRIDTNIENPIRMHFVPRSEEKFAKISEIHGEYVHRTREELQRSLSE